LSICQFSTVLAIAAGLSFYAVPAYPDAPRIPLSSQPTSEDSPLNLNDAIKLALATNPAIESASQQVNQAKARAGQAQAQKRFQFSFNSTVSGANAKIDQSPSQTENYGTFQNTITAPLPIGARPNLAVLQTQKLLNVAQAQYDSAKRTMTGQVESAYFDALLKQELLKSAQETQNEAQRQLDETQKRNKAGDAPDLDVLRAESPLASAKAALYQAQNALNVSKETLNDLMGNNLDQDLKLPQETPPQTQIFYTLDQARILAVQNSPDAHAAEENIKADEAALAYAKLSREPTYSLQVSDTRSNDITSFSRNDAVQLSATIPIGDSGLAGQQIKEAEAALKQAKSQADLARRAALLGASAAYLTAQSNVQQVVATKAALDIAQTAYDKTLQGYQNGLFALTDVLNAQASLASARNAYIQSVYSSALSMKILENAIGENK
jgi:outer membrane protein TolC